MHTAAHRGAEAAKLDGLGFKIASADAEDKDGILQRRRLPAGWTVQHSYPYSDRMMSDCFDAGGIVRVRVDRRRTLSDEVHHVIFCDADGAGVSHVRH